MNKYYKYIRYIIKHKWYVAQECFKYGLYWQGIIHDWSKFLPSEFFPYVEYFYGNGNEDNFNCAWLYHQRRNKHHHQYWILREDSGRVYALEMPIQYAHEMVCDWIGAGKAINGKNDIINWYGKNKDKMILHDNTRKLVENLIYGRTIKNK